MECIAGRMDDLVSVVVIDGWCAGAGGRGRDEDGALRRCVTTVLDDDGDGPRWQWRRSSHAKSGQIAIEHLWP